MSKSKIDKGKYQRLEVKIMRVDELHARILEGLSDKESEALKYLQYSIGILADFRKGFMSSHSKPTDDSLLLDNETEPPAVNCLVCNHEKLEDINRALQDGRPLRELETEFDISRSTLSRHKNSCLNLGGVRFIDAV